MADLTEADVRRIFREEIARVRVLMPHPQEGMAYPPLPYRLAHPEQGMNIQIRSDAASKAP